jgi:hypothetical protein
MPFHFRLQGLDVGGAGVGLEVGVAPVAHQSQIGFGFTAAAEVEGRLTTELWRVPLAITSNTSPSMSASRCSGTASHSR